MLSPLIEKSMVLDMRHVSELLVPGFGLTILLCRGKMPLALGMAAYVQDDCGAFRQPKFEAVVAKCFFFVVCSVRININIRAG